MDLKEMKVRDVLQLEEFRRQLEDVMSGEVANQNKAAYDASKAGARLSRTPLDRLREKGAWETDKMIDYFANVLNKSLIGFGAGERLYIHLVGMEAFKRTMAKLKEKEGGGDSRS